MKKFFGKYEKCQISLIRSSYFSRALTNIDGNFRKWCDQYGGALLEVVRKEYKDHVNEIKSMSIAINKES